MPDSAMSDWSIKEMVYSRLPDERYRRVCSEVLDAAYGQTDLSFSAACGPALRQAAGRLLRHAKVAPDDLLAGHGFATVERCMGEKTIVVASDTTDYNFSSHQATTGLGPLNDSDSVMGIHQHSALAMTERRLPLGIVWTKLWVRPTEGRCAKNRRKLPIERKESYRWIETANNVESLFEPYFEAGGRVVLVGDRESDIFDLFAAERHPQMEHLVRAAYARNVRVNGVEGSCSLLAATATASCMGEYDLAVPAREKKPARTARMELRSVHVMLKPPKNGVGHSKEPVPVWVVEAKERAPKGLDVIPLQWTLITTLDASTEAAARRVVRLYSCRWQIEQFHYTLKSGCKAERLQMDDADTLRNTLALYSIVAWRLLYITHLARTQPDAPASSVIDETEQAVLTQATRKKVTTVAEVVAAIAKMAGHEAYKNGPPPGVKRIWLGLRKLQDLAAGWKLAIEAIKCKQLLTKRSCESG